MADATTRVQMGTTPWGDDKIIRGLRDTVTTYYPGQMMCRDSGGFAVSASDTAGLAFDGVNAESDRIVVISGAADGDYPMWIERPWRITMAIFDTAAAGDEGMAVYVKDNQTVTYSSSNSILVGYVDLVLAANVVLINPLYAPLNPVAVSDNTLAFSGSSTANQITMPDNLADALSIAEGSNEYLTFTTTNGSEAITAKKQVAISSTTANALDVGPNGTTNPTLQIDGSTSSAATGLKIKSAAAAAGLAVSVISSGTNENMTLDAKGSGTITFGSVSTGNVVCAQNLLLSASGKALGYATGAGGAVTQASSRTTGVAINKATGAITLVSAAGSATPFTMTVTNSVVAATDTVIVSQKSGTDAYSAEVSAVAAGSFALTITDLTGTTTEQPVFNFNVIKGVAS